MKKLVFVFLVLAMACNNSYDPYQKKSLDALDKAELHPGKDLMETNCYVCHSPTAGQGNRLAPPMAAVKMHYFSEDKSKEQFIAEIRTWVENPIEENAKMFGAVRRFGVMAKTPFPQETVEQIADYMYSFDIDQPEWFEDHVKQMGNCDN